MQEQMDPIEQPDRFSNYLRQRLEDHRMPVEAGGWEDINTRLSRAELLRKRLLVAGLLAVAVLTGLIWLIRPVDQPMPQNTPVQSVVRTPLPQHPSLSPAEEENKAVPATSALSSPSRMLAVTSRPVEKAPVADPVILTEEDDEEEKTETPPVGKGTEEVPIQPGKRGEATVPVDKNNRWTANGGNVPARRRTAAGDRSSWLIAGGIGTGNSVSLTTFDYDMPHNDPSSTQSPGGEGTSSGGVTPSNPFALYLPSQDNYRDITYHLPLSFSLMVRKNLTPSFAVESGLVYTYLHNSYDSHYSLQMKSEYDLHYLGIPVNGVVNLMNRTRWNIYLSAGIMAERSVSAYYTNTIYNKEGINTQTVHPSIKGLQWSINSSLGVSYRILPHWSLYAEPRFSYYFDNNQPETIRTEHPVTLGIGGGVRYEF